MCNCSSIPNNICGQCAQGNTCGCPPDYSIVPQPVPCNCCPDGYTYYIDSIFPNGICKGPNGNVAPGVCNDCTQTSSSNCIYLPAIPCLNISAGMTLTQFLNYMCSEAYIINILQSIGLSPILQQAICQIVSTCPVIGSATPVLGPIIITYP